jgi:hypothetical protein
MQLSAQRRVLRRIGGKHQYKFIAPVTPAAHFPGGGSTDRSVEFLPRDPTRRRFLAIMKSWKRRREMKVAALVILAAIGAFILPGETAAQDQPAATSPPAAKPDSGMGNFVLSLDFNNATIAQATNFLRVESKRLDPDNKGVSFIISPAATSAAKPITLALNNVTLDDALKEIGEVGGLKLTAEGRVIHVFSLAEKTDEAAGPKPTAGNNSEAATTLKLHSLIIDRVNFNQLDIAAVMQFLAQKSKDLDPDHKGINFVLADLSHADPQHPVRRSVSVVLDNVPLSDLLTYITQQTNLKYSIEDNIVTFKP